MPTDFTIQDFHIQQFTGNVELLLQQKQPRLAGCVTTSNNKGEDVQLVLQLGEVEMEDFNSGQAEGEWKGDTKWGDIEHFQRWVFPSAKVLSLPIVKQNLLRMMTDPTSPYAESMRAAYARTADDYIINAATGMAKTGRFNDMQNTAFPASQILDSAGAEGLTIDKLIDAKEKLIAAGNDPNEPRFFACSEKQLSDLLKSTKVQSADYNTVKALVKGEVDTFVGFKFISTERLKSVPGVRNCLAWVKSGLHFATWDSLTFKSDERPDKNYVRQLWMSCTLGATRTQEKKVVQVNCKE